MLTIKQSLKAINLYPINPDTLQNITEECGFNGNETATSELRQSAAYRKAKAMVYQYLASAPAVSEAGATYSFTEEERKQFRQLAKNLLSGDDGGAGLIVGYVGENF